jgi:hypothetical protein
MSVTRAITRTLCALDPSSYKALRPRARAGLAPVQQRAIEETETVREALTTTGRAQEIQRLCDGPEGMVPVGVLVPEQTVL